MCVFIEVYVLIGLQLLLECIHMGNKYTSVYMIICGRMYIVLKNRPILLATISSAFLSHQINISHQKYFSFTANQPSATGHSQQNRVMLVAGRSTDMGASLPATTKVQGWVQDFQCNSSNVLMVSPSYMAIIIMIQRYHLLIILHGIRVCLDV